jgi:hypothetical protein
VNILSVAILCGRAGRLAAENGGFRPGQTYLTDPGSNFNAAPFDTCYKAKSNINGGGGVFVTVYSCASMSIREKNRNKCHDDKWGDEPWSETGLVEPGGLFTSTYHCCNQGGCNNPPTPEAIAKAAAAVEARVAATVTAEVRPRARPASSVVSERGASTLWANLV